MRPNYVLYRKNWRKKNFPWSILFATPRLINRKNWRYGIASAKSECLRIQIPHWKLAEVKCKQIALLSILSLWRIGPKLEVAVSLEVCIRFKWFKVGSNDSCKLVELKVTPNMVNRPAVTQWPGRITLKLIRIFHIHKMAKIMTIS